MKSRCIIQVNIELTQEQRSTPSSINRIQDYIEAFAYKKH